MRKVTLILIAMVMAGAMLSGCYTKTCEPMSYKGEVRS